MLPSCEWISDGVNNLCRFTREYPPHQWTSLFSSRGRIEDCVANSKSKPRSRKFRLLLRSSQLKRTHAIYVCD